MATRRAVVAALVVVCVLLFSLYAREGDDGPLHSLQGVAGALTAPFQGVASKAVRPLRDGWTWVREASGARDRVVQLEEEVRRLNTRIAEGQYQKASQASVRALQGVGADWRGDYGMVTADIIATSPSPWYERARIDVGTSDGVMVGAPVLAPTQQVTSALAGTITSASSHQSIVTFITEPSSGVGVYLLPSGSRGLAQPSAAGQMRVTGIPRRDSVRENDIAYTSGRTQPLSRMSLFPRGIPVGWVAGAGGPESDEEYTVQLTPFVRPAAVDYVVVMTPRSDRAKQRARLYR